MDFLCNAWQNYSLLISQHNLNVDHGYDDHEFRHGYHEVQKIGQIYMEGRVVREDS